MTDTSSSSTPAGRRRPGPRKPRPPYDAETLRAAALRYVERYATTRAKLIRFLERKLRERGWAGEGAPQTEALADRFAELGYVNDRLFGEARARSLAARGYGPARVGLALGQAGVDADLRQDIVGEVEAHAALTAFARRKRIGPFAAEPADREVQRKQFAACLRAGHGYDLVKKLFDAETAEAFADAGME